MRGRGGKEAGQVDRPEVLGKRGVDQAAQGAEVVLGSLEVAQAG